MDNLAIAEGSFSSIAKGDSNCYKLAQNYKKKQNHFHFHKMALILLNIRQQAL